MSLRKNNLIVEHKWTGDLCIIRLPKCTLALTTDEFVRALRRGKGFLRARQRQEAFERGRNGRMDKGFTKIR